MSASITLAAPPQTTPEQWPWHPCGRCWGQGRIFEMGGVMTDTETGYRQRLYFGKDCPACMGIGSVPESFEI